MTTETEQCDSTSPTIKFDAYARRCVERKGHEGVHHAPTSHGSSDIILPQYDYEIWWDDDGRFLDSSKPQP